MPKICLCPCKVCVGHYFVMVAVYVVTLSVKCLFCVLMHCFYVKYVQIASRSLCPHCLITLCNPLSSVVT